MKTRSVAMLIVGAVAVLAGLIWWSWWAGFTEERKAAERYQGGREKAALISKTNEETLLANKPKAIAEALARKTEDPSAGLLSLLRYEKYKDPDVQVAVTALQIALREKRVATARKYLTKGDAELANEELLAYQGAFQSPDVTKLMTEISSAITKKRAAEEKAELASRKRTGVHIGMTAERVIQSNWGKPESINRTITARGTHEQWVYSSSRGYLYFDNGILTSIQN